jgi:hypothetical protein
MCGRASLFLSRVDSCAQNVGKNDLARAWCVTRTQHLDASERAQTFAIDDIESEE